jgi:hypothetical protein
MSAFAIDPGAGGGIAYKWDGWIKADTMPETVVDLADKIRELKVAGFDTCYLEEIPKFAGKNASSMMKLSTRYGECRGILAALGVYVFVDGCWIAICCVWTAGPCAEW